MKINNRIMSYEINYKTEDERTELTNKIIGLTFKSPEGIELMGITDITRSYIIAKFYIKDISKIEELESYLFD